VKASEIANVSGEKEAVRKAISNKDYLRISSPAKPE
tara:strand:+ start:293 stop:400 length:108 start_codon:yes stop_codon:yes gene_type:complete